MDPVDALPDQLARTRLFARGVPERFTIVDDGATVLFLRGRAGDDPDTCLWSFDAETGVERLLAERVDTYATDDTGRLIAYATGGRLAVIRDGEQRLSPVEGPVTDPRPDPTGRRIAYVRDGALRVVDGDDDRELAASDGPEVSFGIGEHTTDARGFWWSPDGNALLVARIDASRVERWHLADPADPTRPPRVLRYAAVGTPNVDASLWIVGLDGSRVEVRWDRAAYEYLPAAGWDADGPYAVVQSRDQRTARYLAIGPGGDTIVLAEWTDPCWTQVVPGLPALTATGALVAHADIGDTRHLTIDGDAVTPPGLQVRSVLSVDGERVLFTASDEPTETHVWSYDGRLVRLTDGSAVHTGCRRHGTSVTVSRDLTAPGGRFLVRRKESPDQEIRSFAERPVLAPHRIRMDLGDLGLRAALHLPSWHRPGMRLPVLLDPYGGGALQRVTAELTWRVLISQWFAEQGFAVVVADGRGTPGRGPAWERAVHGDLYRLVLEDQLTALREAARRQPDLDLDRVGIRGWSFSGGLAIRAVLRHPEVFSAAVAGAGVTDQRLYNAHWRERFLGHPDEFPERYEECSLIREAATLRRPLLLMHGMLDDNVHVVNTLRFADALSRAGRDHELMLIPGAGHRPFATPAAGAVLRRQAGFLRDRLGITHS
ncbi:S9 family peptidase [Fodinicola acaciae]|uniref:S9 family peptidase n=1 Tax=Fodinicola acaciae TaxID=2681555 RepID=UPI0013CFD0CD|nr:prolyl oligopeptidase family serine peptidase [Fodinicola acaciae]